MNDEGVRTLDLNTKDEQACCVEDKEEEILVASLETKIAKALKQKQDSEEYRYENKRVRTKSENSDLEESKSYCSLEMGEQLLGEVLLVDHDDQQHENDNEDQHPLDEVPLAGNENEYEKEKNHKKLLDEQLFKEEKNEEVPLIDNDDKQFEEAKVLVGQGMQILNLGEDYVDNAIDLFKLALEIAQKLDNTALDARLYHCVAIAYEKCPDRVQAAPSMYEMAADMFISIGETSDALSCITSAASIYIEQNENEQAIHLYQKYDPLVDSGGKFADQLAQLLIAYHS